jgi:hypothetical protein
VLSTRFFLIASTHREGCRAIHVHRFALYSLLSTLCALSPSLPLSLSPPIVNEKRKEHEAARAKSQEEENNNT